VTSLGWALHRVVVELDKARVPYMVIGGVANLVWGVPRATFDVDLTAWVEPAGEKAAVKRLSAAFKALPKNPLAFMEETRVLPLDIEGTKVDLIFGQLPYEKRAVERARTVEFGGHRVKVCTPEDLVVHKIIAERPKDEEDLKGLAKSVGGTLDRAYLDPLVRSLAVQLERPDLWARFERLFGKAG
jgi:predicted nucleotidyltransferase